MRRFTSTAAAAAVLLTTIAATPADARGRHGGWGHHDRGRVSTGEVVGGLLLLGAIVAIADAAGKDRQRERERQDRYEPPYEDADHYVPRYDADAPAPAGAYGANEAEARAADACSWAVEAEMGDGARVDHIDSPRSKGDGWAVTGTASRANGADERFDCTVRNGRVIDVAFGN